MFLIIHNPLSNNRKSKKTTNKWVKFFKKNHIPFSLRSTLKIENLNTYLDNNKTITDILYLGGDGSINYLINNVDVSKVSQNIYLSKSGSGNDFLRSLKQIKEGPITIGEAKTNVSTTKFINGCGVGVDASVCYYVNNDKKKNKLSYFINVFKAVVKYKRIEMDVTVDGTKHSFTKAYLVSIQNGKYYGGGMKVAPQANPTNDTFQICVAHSLTNALIFLLFLTIYPGLHIYIKKRITVLEGKEISVKTSEKRYFQADGEVLEDVNELSVKKVETRQFIAFNKKDIKKKFN